MTNRQRRAHTAKTGRKPPLYAEAGLRSVRGAKGRPWEVVSTGERISYNKGRARIAALSDRQRSKVSLFERALGRTKNVDEARRESGLSQRGLAAYRQSFATSDRGGASPWAKEKGRWRFEPDRLSYTHTFLNVRDGGRWLHVAFVGRELIAMQNWRTAAFGTAFMEGGSQAQLDDWEKANPAGVVGADGQTYWPETDYASIQASLKRMSRRDRKRIEESVRYKTKGRDH
jgi:hypothetical protein